MDLKTYYLKCTQAERELLAARCNTSLGHLRNVAYGKTCGESLAIDIDRETRGLVTCEELRSDVDWAYLRESGIRSSVSIMSTDHIPHIECCSGDPRHGERRRPEMRDQIDRRKDEAA